MMISADFSDFFENVYKKIMYALTFLLIHLHVIMFMHSFKLLTVHNSTLSANFHTTY